jgi:hypothetical protein
MTIDISKLEYEVELLTETGTRYLLNDALLSLQWEEQENELAQRATVMAANMAIGSTWLMAIAKINCVILVYGKWGGARTLLFEGTIWDWQYQSASQRALTITAYDNLIRLQQSKDFKYYSAGMTTQDLIGDICNSWGVPFDYQWGQSLTHEKKVFSADTISNMIISLLDEVKKKTGEKYIAYFRDGKLQIVDYGSNQTVYKFDNETTISTLDKLTINNLVTQVKIIGKQDDEGRAAVDALVVGDTSFGVLQEIIRRDSDKTIGDATDEANALIKERGKPESTTTVNVPDLPFLRKGDKVDMAAGNLLGIFYVIGVTHNATQRQMTLTLSRG